MTHQVKKPVSIERELPDWVIIEGVRYDGDYFRTYAHPDTDVLYAVRNEDDVVRSTVIRNVEEAMKFFEEIASTAAAVSQ
jgi:hypothetical protein